jgi:hypothetical protein
MPSALPQSRAGTRTVKQRLKRHLSKTIAGGDAPRYRKKKTAVIEIQRHDRCCRPRPPFGVAIRDPRLQIPQPKTYGKKRGQEKKPG